MEANPGSAGPEICGLQGRRHRRLSLGIQSFDDACLQALGGESTTATRPGGHQYARAAGFDSFNIDLMHGLPAVHRRRRHGFANRPGFCPPHLSWYQRRSRPNAVSTSGRRCCQSRIPLADIQHAGEQLLAAAGYRQYEVSAYSQAGLSLPPQPQLLDFRRLSGYRRRRPRQISLADGQIVRYAKKRQPHDYMAAAGLFHRQSHQAHRAGYHRRSCLTHCASRRLRLAQFSATTGQGLLMLEHRLQDFQRRDC